MYSALSPGAIGVTAVDPYELIKAAHIGGFEGVEVMPAQIADMVSLEGAEPVIKLFANAMVKPAGWGLPVAWRESTDEWHPGLKVLPRLAGACSAIGCPLTFTWIMPMSDEREFEANWNFHIERLKPVAEILGENGCRLGLEFIGPKSLRQHGRYQFVYTMGEMLKLAEAIGPNVGLLLDCWHWYTSGGTVEQIEALNRDQVVYVHVNDAPAGIDVDLQQDNVRCLPGETGVIDIKGFLGALYKIAYDGPVVPEPFKKELMELHTDADRLKAAGDSMRAIGL